ncbi:acid phosphatase-domain-containing protein [Crepidotus variabilis]|uniref:Acid phosphatase-domain-containing protein n=1 Tax=Crepidotus variabilis TaxID=179855 RepID=A0A9P6E8Y3_9AGAR|nr:acid phosphatase-domain-containing protein [Crepidotus variabilis]
MSFPKVVGLDTDWTIWQNYLDGKKWGKARGAFAIQEDNINRVDRTLLQDKTNKNNWIRVYNDISKVVNDILKNNAKLAIVSRNTSKNLCDRTLYYFNAINPKDNKEWSIIHMVSYDEVKDGEQPESKANHWKRIKGWAEADYSEMLMFDDEAFNNVVRVELGVSFQLARDNKGLTWDTYQKGLKAWKGARDLMIAASPGRVHNRVLIGYSGLPPYWIDFVREGRGAVDPTTPYRWGYALYVASSMGIAKYFTDWNNNWNKEKSFLCEVWVKDYDAWTQMNKAIVFDVCYQVWVPENNGNVPQMNSMHASSEATGMNQENRDRTVGERWGVPMPYVLFSQHFWMSGMPAPKSRWTEMVIYTQIYRALIEVKPLTDAEIKKITNPEPFPFNQQFKTWGIKAPAETRAEFWRYNEKATYNASA